MPGPRALAGRWSRSERSPSAIDRERIDAVLEANRVDLWTAIRVDAAQTARFRGEHHRFRNGFDALVQVVRLCFVTDSFFAQACYRLRVACRERRVPLVPSLLHRISVVTGQVSIGDLAVIRPGLYLPHGQVVIDGMTLVEENVSIRPFVTLGLVDGHIFGPSIGAGARIGTGAKVVGQVRVGPRAQIGANAVVLRDVPEGATAVGVPARVRPPTE